MRMSNIYKALTGLLLVLLTTTMLSAQSYQLSGVVKSAETGEALIGANVYLKGTTYGAATNVDGSYKITVPGGKYTVVASYVGFESVEEQINLTGNMEVNFSLKDYQFSLSVTVIADRAKERETPVAFTNIDKKQIEQNLGSRDIPLVLNTTPSVYATSQGGGAGDARVNIRGFDQRNIAIMINGVPINDMENGWVYWSNWDGVGDATSSIQVQRGLSAVNLATPSVGGTMNIITDPAQAKAGVLYKNEYGSGSFQKQTLFASTGLINNKFAMTVGGVKKFGLGHADRTWTDAWAYYLGASYQINEKNRIELYATGAPQRHGQRSYMLNAATFSHDYAKELGYSNSVLADPKLREQGLLYNSNWNSINSSYQGKQYWNSSSDLRFNETYMMERENYYHKPIINLNWYTQLSSKLSLYTTAYYSGGTGGGTGTFGGIQYYRGLMQQVVDWDATIANNLTGAGAYDVNGDGVTENVIVTTDRRSDPTYVRGGILRNSVNNQWTIGAISKAYLKVNKELNLSFGVDWRTAEIEHYREIRDMLGNDYYHFNGNAFESGSQYFKQLGDKIDYDFTNTVNWLGGYVQGEYTTNRWTFFGMGGYSIIKYKYENFFRKGPDGSTLKQESDNIGGYQIKGGASYRINPEWDVFVNGGYVSKVPIFDQVINDQNGSKIADPKNEKILSFEGGVNASLLNKVLNLKANFYYTTWKDRGESQGVRNADGSDGLVYLSGVGSLHSGVELEVAFQPIRYARLDAAASFANWKYTENVSGSYVSDFSTGATTNFNFYLKDLKVGDAPQTQFAVAGSVFPISGMTAQIVWKYNSNHYANFDPFSRTQAYFAGEQSWKTPSYSLFDLHFSYDIPVSVVGFDVSLFAHVFNLLDEVYVQDAVDNSQYNGYYTNNPDRNGDGRLNNEDGMHTADDAEVFLGLPRSFNFGFSVRL